MAETEILEAETEEISNLCSTCLRKSHEFYELKPLESNFLLKVHEKAFHVCHLCKLALDFVAKFERLCEFSRQTVEKYDAIEIQTDFYSEDPKVERALEALCDWARGLLEENERVYELEPMKTEVLVEEYLAEESEEYEEAVNEEILVESPAEIKVEKRKTFDCDFCEEKFGTKREMEKHEGAEHGFQKPKKELECTESDCSFKAASQLKLNRHLQAAHNVVVKKAFCCDVCGQVYPSKCRLQYHMNCHLNISPFLCDFEGCTRAFRNPTRLRNHKQEFHLQVIRCHCAICGKGFRTKASHDLHILGHDKPTIPCEVCGKLLTNRKTLRTHLMTHTGERRYKCEIPGCNKAFTKCSGLQVHMRSHTKERPYKCPHCSLTFTYKVSMKKHMLKYHDVPWETSSYVRPETQKNKENTKMTSLVEIQAT